MIHISLFSWAFLSTGQLQLEGQFEIRTRSRNLIKRLHETRQASILDAHPEASTRQNERMKYLYWNMSSQRYFWGLVVDEDTS